MPRAMMFGQTFPTRPEDGLPVWLDAEPTPRELGLWKVSHDGAEIIAPLERMPIALLSKELHATHMAIHGILALPEDVPMASIRVEPLPEWYRAGGACNACWDGTKVNCDNAACPRGQFDPEAIQGNKTQRIKGDLLPKCIWILNHIREREARLSEPRRPPHGRPRVGRMGPRS